jgi:UDP-MurNAc hydroxylase
MRFQFIGNACGIFEGSDQTRILCDPWIVNGVFDGSWCHYPPLKTTIDDFQNVDAIYVSHLHPDHYDQRFFDFPKDISIFVLDHEPNYLTKMLSKSGYSNIIKIKDGETFNYREFSVTLFAPFVKHPFFESEIGNLIDSAMLLKCGDFTAFNTNDNTPDIDSCTMIAELFGQVDLAMLNYNAAGPYPSCFDNLSEQEKIDESHHVINRNIENMHKLVEALKPKYVLPFAGAYVIGGKHYKKNRYLGTTTWDKCGEYLRKNLRNETSVVCLRESDTFDLSTGRSDKKYIPIDENHMKRYIGERLAGITYDYERDPVPDLSKLTADIAIAVERMSIRASKFDITMDTNVNLILNGEKLNIVSVKPASVNLDCELDSRLLRRILDRKAHWNNAEIGCHITFWREPNTYQPDVHTVLQFFHL